MVALASCSLQRAEGRPCFASKVVQCRSSQRGGEASCRPAAVQDQPQLGRRALIGLGAALAVGLADPRVVSAGEQRVALITGANSGIGYATAQILMEQGWTTVLGCRSVDAAEQAASRLRKLDLPGSVKVLQGAALDLGDLAQVRAFAKEYAAAGLPLDALVNNAGIMAVPEGRTADGLESQWGGHFALTMGLLPAVRESKGRVVNVSSLACLAGQLDLTDLLWQRRPYETWGAYGASKLSNVLFTQELARREGSAITTNVCHPGFVATNLARSILPPDLAKGARDDPEEYARKAKFFGLKTPREGAECQVWLTAAQGEATSGDGKGAPGRSAPPGLIFTEPGETFKVPQASGKEARLSTSAFRGEKLAQDLWAPSEELLAANARGEKAGDLLLGARATPGGGAEEKAKESTGSMMQKRTMATAAFHSLA